MNFVGKPISLITAVVLSLSLFGCSSAPEKETAQPTPAPQATAPIVEAAAPVAHPAPPVAVAPPSPQEAAHVAAPTHHRAVSEVDPGMSLKWLKNGNARFLKGWLRKDGRSQKDVKRLATGQKPHSIVLSCSDSRVPPEHVFDQGLGELFTVRTAGEALNDNVIASIEYAVEHLGSRLIVVMGHTNCGAVKAAIGAKQGESAGSPALDALVADIKPRLPPFALPTKDLIEESTRNTTGVAGELIKRSKIIAEKVESGEIKIQSALYHLDTGAVDWL